MKTAFLTLAFLLIIVSCVRAQNFNGIPVQATVSGGIIEGDFDNKTGIKTYFGIPYAAPPTGKLRWKAPQKAQAWNGVKHTKKFGHRPVQAFLWPDMIFRSEGLSEDCLTLNVWTPVKHNTSGLPVLVYFHGGGNVGGDGSELRYDGEALAKEGIVVITVNYRLNIFGFLAHPELSEEASYGASGNYGSLDQAFALNWVKDNAAAFGGDPERITIGGESAGSMAVSLHMASPLSRNVLAGAIGQSGALIKPTGTPVTLAEAEQMGKAFVDKTGYTFAEFRQLPTATLHELYQEHKPALPINIDGYLLPKTLPEIFEAGEQAQVPLLVGWNSAELPAQVFLKPPFTREAFETMVKGRYGALSPNALDHYPGTSGRALEKAISDFGSDNWIVFSTWKWFDLHRKHSPEKVYRYLFAKLRPANDKGKRPPALGAPHAAEIEYALGNLDRVPIWQWTEEDHTVSKTMMSYFANFIKRGNPNGEGLPNWTAASPQDNKPPVMRLDTKSELQNAQRDARFLVADQFYQSKR